MLLHDKNEGLFGRTRSADPKAVRPRVESNLVFLSTAATEALARSAVESVTPLWSLQRFVAVNPLQGSAGVPLVEAVSQVAESRGAHLLPDLDFFQVAYESGAFSAVDVHRAVGLLDDAVNPQHSVTATDVLKSLHERCFNRSQGAAGASHAGGGPSSDAAETWITEQNAKCLSALLWENGSAWRAVSPRQELVANWQRFIKCDLSFDANGYGRLRTCLAALPSSSTDLFALLAAECLDHWTHPCSQNLKRLFARLVSKNHGWMAFARFLDHEAGLSADNSLALQVLCIQVATELALLKCGLASPLWRKLASSAASHADAPSPEWDRSVRERLVLLESFESGLRSRFLSPILKPESFASPSEPERFRLVFCIDPRSERMRRHAERVQADVRTTGFAGFFALPLAHGPVERSARCPILVEPSLGITLSTEQAASAAGAALRIIKKSLSTTFSFVEAAGLFYAHALVREAFFPSGRRGRREQAENLASAPQGHLFDLQTGVPLGLDARVGLACSFLRHSGLGHCQAKVVLLCGHGSSSDNNAHGTALDCGACGGHKGDVNAIAAALLLNDPEVRTGVVRHGFTLPPDLFFVAGLHDTTTGSVALFPIKDPSEQQKSLIAELRTILDQATECTLKERSASENWELDTQRSSPSSEARLRSASIGEVRPEWGLARNAFFIAAPRSRTVGVNLDGRAFLHDYDHRLDPLGETLELILTAPLLVAHGISMQYFASTVDNAHFGSGSKLLQSVVGNFGVFEGTSHELRTGLPLQSVHDGQKVYHEPVRLQVVIEAPTEQIDVVLRRHKHVADLVVHQWLTLFAIEPSSHDFRSPLLRCRSPGVWQVWEL